MKQVNLKEILLNAFIQYKENYPEKKLSKAYTIEQFKDATEILTVGMNAMQEACNQTINLCAENVGFIKTTSEKLNSEDYKPFITADDDTVWTFNKQAILDTKKQII